VDDVEHRSTADGVFDGIEFDVEVIAQRGLEGCRMLFA
jgi:hypothetical protein